MIRFYTPPADFSSVSSAPRIARVRKDVRDTRTLLASVGEGLNFPPYFGKNLDAFWDCIRDLDVEERSIVILHDDLPKIPREDMAAYLEILRDAALYWRQRPGEYHIETWFPRAEKKKVERLLGKIPPPDPGTID